MIRQLDIHVAIIEELSASQAREIEKKENEGFFKRRSVIAKISLIYVTTFFAFIITPLVLFHGAAVGWWGLP